MDCATRPREEPREPPRRISPYEGSQSARRIRGCAEPEEPWARARRAPLGLPLGNQRWGGVEVAKNCRRGVYSACTSTSTRPATSVPTPSSVVGKTTGPARTSLLGRVGRITLGASMSATSARNIGPKAIVKRHTCPRSGCPCRLAPFGARPFVG